jgi:putative flippase GtrA
MALQLNLGVAVADRTGDISPLELLSYRAIAAIALLAHLTCLWLVGDVVGNGLALAQTLAAIAASMIVYGIKAAQAYRQRGPWRWYLGLLPFLASCWFGIACSVLLALALAHQNLDGFAAGLCGAVFGLWWNRGAVSRHGWSNR